MDKERKFYTQYDLPPNKPRLACKDASLTRQEFMDECDLNKIMDRYAKGLAPLPSGKRPPMFGDFSNIPDYQKCLDIVNDANERFMTLPSHVRAEFDNDPGKLLAFLNNEENRARAIELGLIDPPATPPADDKVSVPGTGVA